MILNKKALFIFPVGGRGDFLTSILYGNKLKRSFDLDEILFPVENSEYLMKTHGWTNCEYSGVLVTPESLKQIDAVKWLIVAPTFQEIFDIGYLTWYKKVKIAEEIATLRQLSPWIHLTKLFNEQVDNYKSEFNYVVNFKDLFDVEFIKRLNQEINDQELDDQELYRIKHNIDHNNQILKTCPFKFDSWDGFMEVLAECPI